MLEQLINIFKQYTVPILTIACVPLVSFILSCFKEEVGVNWGGVFVLTLVFIVFGISSIYLFGMIHDGELFPASTPQHQGLLFLIPIWIYFAHKYAHCRLSVISDVTAVILPFVIGGIRLYCIAQGCCFGTCIWGMDGVYWPVREMTILVNMVIGAVLFVQLKRYGPDGRLLPFYLIMYSIVRFSEVSLWGDVYRDSQLIDRALALLMLMLGVGLLWEVDSTHETVR